MGTKKKKKMMMMRSGSGWSPASLLVSTSCSVPGFLFFPHHLPSSYLFTIDLSLDDGSMLLWQLHSPGVSWWRQYQQHQDHLHPHDFRQHDHHESPVPELMQQHHRQCKLVERLHGFEGHAGSVPPFHHACRERRLDHPSSSPNLCLLLYFLCPSLTLTDRPRSVTLVLLSLLFSLCSFFICFCSDSPVWCLAFAGDTLVSGSYDKVLSFVACSLLLFSCLARSSFHFYRSFLVFLFCLFFPVFQPLTSFNSILFVMFMHRQSRFGESETGSVMQHFEDIQVSLLSVIIVHSVLPLPSPTHLVAFS